MRRPATIGKHLSHIQAIEAIPEGKELRAKASCDWDGLPDEFLTREQFVYSAVPISTFAILKDGEWMERGSMGWFACVADEKPRDQWAEKVSEVIRNIPGESWVTIVDCHI